MDSEIAVADWFFSRFLGRGWCVLALVAAVFACGFSRGEDDSTKTLGPPGWLGLAIDDSLVPGRLVVVEVDAGGPASQSGIQVQDMVLAIDGEPTLDADRFAAVIATITPGENVRFSVARGGTVEELTLVAAEAPQPKVPRPSEPPATTSAISDSAGFSDAKEKIADEIAARPRSAFGQPPSPFPVAVEAPTPASASPAAAPALSEPKPAQPPWQGSTGFDGVAAPGRDAGRSKTALGVRTVPVDPVVQARYGLPEPAGALVVGLVEDLPASRAGLPTGSVIVAFDRQPVRSPTELTRLVSAGPTDRPVKLEYILPGGESKAAEVSLVSFAPKVDARATSLDSTADADREALRTEIFQMRKAIDSLVRRLEELDRKASAASR